MDVAKDGIALYQSDDKPLHKPRPKTPNQALDTALVFEDQKFKGTLVAGDGALDELAVTVVR